MDRLLKQQTKLNKASLKQNKKYVKDVINDYCRAHGKTLRTLSADDKDILKKQLVHYHQGGFIPGLGSLLTGLATKGAKLGAKALTGKLAWEGAKAVGKMAGRKAKDAAKYVGRKIKSTVQNKIEDFKSRKKPDREVSERVAKKRIKKQQEDYFAGKTPKAPNEDIIHKDGHTYYTPTYKDRLLGEYTPAIDHNEPRYKIPKDKLGQYTMAIVPKDKPKTYDSDGEEEVFHDAEGRRKKIHKNKRYRV